MQSAQFLVIAKHPDPPSVVERMPHCGELMRDLAVHFLNDRAVLRARRDAL